MRREAVTPRRGPGGGVDPPMRCGRTGGERPRALERSARPAGATRQQRAAAADGGFATYVARGLGLGYSWVRVGVHAEASVGGGAAVA